MVESYSLKSTDEEFLLNISNLSGGMYFIEAFYKNKRATGKLMIID